MITDHPLISVVLLNYNGKKYLGNILDNCIISILNSDYSNLELLFVDNGSNDDSIRHVKKKFCIDSRVKIISLQKNYGTAKGKNEV